MPQTSLGPYAGELARQNKAAVSLTDPEGVTLLGLWLGQRPAYLMGAAAHIRFGGEEEPPSEPQSGVLRDDLRFEHPRLPATTVANRGECQLSIHVLRG